MYVVMMASLSAMGLAFEPDANQDPAPDNDV